MSFMNSLENTLNEDFNESITENGAIGYRTTGKNLLDINFAVASLRRASDADIIQRFMNAYYDDKAMAMKWLFFARDIRGGLGERRLFRVIYKHLLDNEPTIAKELIDFIPEYGRWDDAIDLVDTDYSSDIIDLIHKQWDEDILNMKKGKPISLLAKWMPSCNASSKETVRKGRILCRSLHLTERAYRLSLTSFRKYLDVVEVKMSSKNWGDIRYEAVPSRANLIYNDAFLKNDEPRRREFLASLSKGETKINAGTLYPHDIVHQYGTKRTVDATLEGLWKALPDTVGGADNTIVVADGSGSMYCPIGGTNTLAIEVSDALAIYFAERCSGEFENKYITFSSRPQLVNLSGGQTLKDKINIARSHNECSNTNIEAVFNLILNTAISHKMSQLDLPHNILIISDMEFDYCTSVSANLFKTINQKYINAGYKMPRLIFWNVNSRTGTIPVRENELGVALVSGFSPNIAKMVMSGKTDPYECLVETLNSERYQPITDRINRIA